MAASGGGENIEIVKTRLGNLRIGWRKQRHVAAAAANWRQNEERPGEKAKPA
jgi:hypothetical protein